LIAIARNRKIKLLIVINDDYFFCSHFLPISKIIAEQNRYEIYVVTRDTGYKKQIQLAGFHFIHANIRRGVGNIFNNILYFFRLVQIYNKVKPDIIQHITVKNILIGTAASIFYRSASVINYFSGLGYVFLKPPHRILKKLVSESLLIIDRCRKTLFLFENADDQKEILAIIKSDRVNSNIVNGVGIDLEEFHYTPLPDLAIKDILFPARLLGSKGIFDLIEAATLLEEKLSGKARFIIAGKIDRDNPAHISGRQLRNLIDGTYIKWVGHVNDIKPLMAQSSLIVLPSYREGLPKALVEACAIGRAIIAYDVPGCRECVIDNYNGYLVAPYRIEMLAQKIKSLISDHELLKFMGINSRVIAERKFSIYDVSNHLSEIYSQSLNC
jgi:glycosyltransferase involved in cell wall biosynthesis